MRTTGLGPIIAALVAAGLLLSGGATADAAVRSVRLEAGPHVGYRFSTTGAVLAQQATTVTTPTAVSTDRRRVVPNRTGIYLRVTTGTLAGYEVLESPVAYIPGKAGDTAYVPAAHVTFAVGRYLGYAFDADWDLVSTRFRALTRASSASASRRAIIDGRPYVWMSSGIWAGTWIPVTAPRSLTAQRLTCSVPAKPSPGPNSVLRQIATDEARVALTFDMGGRLTLALDIMERLIVDRVCATIFPTGDAAVTTTGSAVLDLVRAHPELFEVGNHTRDHCDLRDGGGPTGCPATPPTSTFIAAQLSTAETIIVARAGRTTKPFWRPPYGAYDTRVRTAATAAGYPTTVMWHVDTIDWRPIADGGPTASAIAAKVVTSAQRGSIVLMHLGGYHTYDALPSMVLRLRAGGLAPSAISDILD
jgi:peptidoglycan/xylan/chitin deacetylase (PgdA/CDA1 family)